MNSRDQKRLERLYPGLSPDQRISAFIESLRRTGKPDRALIDAVPPAHAERFSFQLGLLRVAQADLAWLVSYLEALVGKLELRFMLLLTMLRWAGEAEQVVWYLMLYTDPPTQEDEHAKARTKMFAKLNGRVDAANLRAEAADGELSFDHAPREILAAVMSELGLRWNDLSLAELATEALADELGGNDPLEQDDRALLQDCRVRLQAIHDHLEELGHAVELVEPSSEELDQLLGALRWQALG